MIFFQKREKFWFFKIFIQRGDPLMLKLPNHFFLFFKNWFSFFKKWPLWDLTNVKRNKVMKFGNSNHQNVKMPDWIWSSGPDLAPLSRNRVKETYVCFATILKSVYLSSLLKLLIIYVQINFTVLSYQKCWVKVCSVKW